MTIGGFCFVKDAIKWDYCFEAAIGSMLECCDQVSVVDAGSDDGTKEVLQEWASKCPKLQFVYFPIELWNNLHGRTKLSYFQNAAADLLDTDYQLLVQADEVLHEDSYKWVREAANSGVDGAMCRRYNLWGSPYTVLNVPLKRMPCSPEVLRLTKRGYKTFDDGENLTCQHVNFDYLDKIEIYHMGFVRRREIMKDKIINMQALVFEIKPDEKLNGMDVFDSKAWFGPEDLKPISGSLPRLVQKWALDRE